MPELLFSIHQTHLIKFSGGRKMLRCFMFEHMMSRRVEHLYNTSEGSVLQSSNNLLKMMHHVLDIIFNQKFQRHSFIVADHTSSFQFQVMNVFNHPGELHVVNKPEVDELLNILMLVILKRDPFFLSI